MKPLPDFDETKVNSTFKRLEAGGYVAVIKKAEDHDKEKYLYIEYDIAEGEHAGHYAELEENKGFWGGYFRQYYTKASDFFFGSLIKAIDDSNGTAFFPTIKTTGVDERKLPGKLVGLVIGWEEYTKNNGEISKRTFIAEYKSVDDIRNGNFTVPEFRALEEKPQAEPAPEGFNRISDEEIPF